MNTRLIGPIWYRNKKKRRIREINRIFHENMLGENQNLYMQKFHIVANKLRIKKFMQLDFFPPSQRGICYWHFIALLTFSSLLDRRLLRGDQATNTKWAWTTSFLSQLHYDICQKNFWREKTTYTAPFETVVWTTLKWQWQ